jgi:hypothetical protein
MKTLTITTKAEARKAQLDSLFKPVEGYTLSVERYDRGKYANSLHGKTLKVPAHVHLLYTEPRKDADGRYHVLFALVTPRP